MIQSFCNRRPDAKLGQTLWNRAEEKYSQPVFLTSDASPDPESHFLRSLFGSFYTWHLRKDLRLVILMPIEIIKFYTLNAIDKISLLGTRTLLGSKDSNNKMQ